MKLKQRALTRYIVKNFKKALIIPSYGWDGVGCPLGLQAIDKLAWSDLLLQFQNATMQWHGTTALGEI